MAGEEKGGMFGNGDPIPAHEVDPTKVESTPEQDNGNDNGGDQAPVAPNAQ